MIAVDEIRQAKSDSFALSTCMVGDFGFLAEAEGALILSSGAPSSRQKLNA